MAKDTDRVKKAIKDKCTPEQITAWRYFENIEPDGCLSKWNHVSDAEFDKMLESELAKNGLLTPARALKKLGVDEEDIAIEPICLSNFIPVMTTAVNRYRKGADKVIRTSNYQVTWIICSQSQVFVYQCTFSLLEDDKSEKGEEYFFKDVTNFTTIEIQDEVTLRELKGGGCASSPKEELSKVKYITQKFRITVPGEKLECAMESGEESDAHIRQLKALLRQKKG